MNDSQSCIDTFTHPYLVSHSVIKNENKCNMLMDRDGQYFKKKIYKILFCILHLNAIGKKNEMYFVFKLGLSND